MKEKEIIFGLHSVIAAIKNPKRKIIALKCTNDFFVKNKKIIDSTKIENVTILKRNQINLETKNNVNQGAYLVTTKLKTFDLNEIEENEKLVVILDSLNDSQNVGSILRSAYLFGIKSIIFNKNNSFEINSFLIKASSGAYEKVKIIEVTNLNRTIELLKKKKFWVIGLDINSNKTLMSIPKETKKALVLGSETKGIRKLIQKNCDFLIKINTIKNDKLIDSLNVSNSAAIAFYELTKK